MLKRFFDDPEIFGFLKKLVGNRAETRNIAAVNCNVAAMKEYLEANGIYTAVETMDNGRQVLFASTRPNCKKPAFIINSHLDVVPAINEEQYVLQDAGDELIGRGINDCLGEAVIAARLLIDYKDKNLGVLFSTDEETGGRSVRFMVEKGYGATDFVVVFDGGYKKVMYGQKGILVLKLTARGKGGHSSAPWAHDNPINTLVYGLHKLVADWQNPADQQDWRPSLAPVKLNAGFADNQIPDTAEAVINIRYTKDAEHDEILGKVRTLTGCEVEIVEECVPVDVSPDAPVIKKFQKIMSEVIPGGGELDRMCGATDARHFVALNVPIAVTGLNGEGTAHSAKEHLVKASGDETYEIFRRLIEESDWR